MVTKKYRNVSGRPRYLMGVEIAPGEEKSVKGDQKALENHAYVKRGFLVAEDAPKGKPGPKPAAEKQSGGQEAGE